MKIAALLTCHNRKAKTLACLEALYNNALPVGYSIEVFLVDDGSSDGTSEAVKSRFPEVEIIYGNSNLYWNGGMRLAFAKAMEQRHDFYLFLNDDTLIYPDAVQSLLNTYTDLKAKSMREAIVVGSTQDPDSSLPTYGGVVRNSLLRRLKFTLVSPTEAPTECETMNGNCVLVPARIASDIGNLDAAFTHAMGDFDYGLRARKAGHSVWIMPGYAGTCRRNFVEGSFRDTSIPLAKRIEDIKSVKGLPLGEWVTFTRRHAGPLWFVYAAAPYLRMVFNPIVRK